MVRPVKTDSKIEELAAKLTEALGESMQTERPPDSITAKEYALACGITEEGARYRLNRLEQMGKVEKARVRGVWHYTFKE